MIKFGSLQYYGTIIHSQYIVEPPDEVIQALLPWAQGFPHPGSTRAFLQDISYEFFSRRFYGEISRCHVEL